MCSAAQSPALVALIPLLSYIDGTGIYYFLIILSGPVIKYVQSYK